jgi:hypothetical protein
MKRFLITIAALSFVLAFPMLACACICGVSNVEGAFLSAKVVFVGKVTKIVLTKEASVGLLMKESGTLELLKDPRWETSTYGAQIVTLEISEAFKGATNQTINILTAVYDHGATCGINFKMGENYLVYADDRRTELSAEQTKLPKDQWTKEIQLKAAADKFNERLPALATGICARTERMRWAKDDVEVIRRILKGETIPNDQRKPVRIIY